MAKRHVASRRKQKSPGGVLLTVSVVLLAIAACALMSPPAPREVAQVFARGTPVPSATMGALDLPRHEWYVVDANGLAVAACEKLLEAEIIRDAHGTLASIRAISVEAVSLRITATPVQLTALRQCADAIESTFSSLTRMRQGPQANAASTAIEALGGLDTLCASLDDALHGTENTVVRGLAGLVGSCREAMEDLSKDASLEKIQKKTAALVLQYQSYVQYLSGGRGTTETAAEDMVTAGS